MTSTRGRSNTMFQRSRPRSRGLWFSFKVGSLTSLSLFLMAIRCIACEAVTLDGEVAATITWPSNEFAKLPRTGVNLKDPSFQDYIDEGVDLAVLFAAGSIPLRENLKGTLRAEGEDGFAAVFSLPEFDQNTFLVADRHNGEVLEPDDGPLQIISAQEPRHSRWIKRLCMFRIKKSTKLSEGGGHLLRVRELS